MFGFHFFKISICCVGRRGDGKKQSKMTKNTVHPTPYLRNYIYIIWLSFMVHIRKRIISPSIFFISKYLFLWSLGSLNSKKWSKMTKNCQELYIIGYCDFLYTCVKWWYIIFLKFWIFGFWGSKRAKNNLKFCISESVDHIVKKFVNLQHSKFCFLLTHFNLNWKSFIKSCFSS